MVKVRGRNSRGTTVKQTAKKWHILLWAFVKRWQHWRHNRLNMPLINNFRVCWKEVHVWRRSLLAKAVFPILTEKMPWSPKDRLYKYTFSPAELSSERGEKEVLADSKQPPAPPSTKSHVSYCAARASRREKMAAEGTSSTTGRSLLQSVLVSAVDSCQCPHPSHPSTALLPVVCMSLSHQVWCNQRCDFIKLTITSEPEELSAHSSRGTWPVHCHGVFSQTATLVANIFGNAVSDSEGRVFHCQTNSKCNTTWSKSNVIQTYDGAKVTVFGAVWKRKRPAPSRALLLFPLRRRARRNFYRPSAHRLNTRSNDGEGEVFFFYLRGSFKCMIVILPTFWRSAPALKFSWQLTSNVSLATMLVYSYRRSLDEDGRSLWAGTPRSLLTASSVVNFFSPGAPVTSFLCQQISTGIRRPRFQQDETSSLLDRRRLESIQTYGWYQLVLHLGNIHNAVSRHLDKNCEV